MPLKQLVNSSPWTARMGSAQLAHHPLVAIPECGLPACEMQWAAALLLRVRECR